MRPAATITKEIVVEYFCEYDWMFKNRLEEVTSEVGGLDACPLCTGISETDFA